MTPTRESPTRDADVVPLRGNTSLPTRDDAVVITGVFGSIAFLVLLVACTNVSALVVGAGIARRQEIAVRLSLGASRARVVRQLLTESAMLAIVGGVLGLLVFWWITKLVSSQVTDVDLAPDVATVAFTVFVALGTGIVFGLSPALHATRRGVADVLKDTGAGISKRSRLQRSFVVAQIVLTQPLLVGIAMLIGVVGQTQGDGPNKVDDRIVALRMMTYATSGSFEEKNAAVKKVERIIAELPGVVRVVPDAVGYLNANVTVHPDDRGTSKRAAEPTAVHMEATYPGYFSTLDIPILRGRELEPSDERDRAVIIGDDFARALWGSADPIGKRFNQQSQIASLDNRELVVVGVYDSRYETTRGAGIRVFAASDGRLVHELLVRTAGPAAPLVTAIGAIVRREMPTVPISRLETLSRVKEDGRREALQVGGAAAAGGLLALFLASIGLYAVIALAVGQRRREIGIRMALGARAEQVVALLFSSGVRLSAIGLVLGLPLSVVALRLVASQARIPETSMIVVGGAIGALVLLVACVSTWIPARRAASVDPVSALKSD
ncbi:MAG TPA: FtsX-like permease family protein, partial [Gemmatimonadaceae bacterium]